MGPKQSKLRSPEDLRSLREHVLAGRDDSRPRIVVCGGTGCRSAGSLRLADALREELDRSGVEGDVGLKLSGCHGFCQQGPVVLVEPQGIFYRAVGREDPVRDARDIVAETIAKGEVVERLLYTDPSTGGKVTRYDEIPFYARQTRIVLRNNGKIDPFSIEDYVAVGGYSALAKALSMDSDEVISCIERSGLRGRGGAGFPTGRKWRFCREANDRSLRCIVCNADEGDPGAFMDRSIIEGDPHSVLEGMIIGAYAMSSGIARAEGYVYIRAEYPLAIETLRAAIHDAEELGLLGDGILGGDFGFHVKIKQGAGAFVCGEETALMSSIEGRRGMPRVRPPFPAQSGLFGKPTNINNVETWANVPAIVDRGADWYAGIGTEGSKGTKVFSLVGKVKNSGLIEVPMGTKLREIIFGIGGGIPGGKRFKAVQTGGPSGGCLPASCLELTVDYDTLAEAGSIMGSGGMVVMDEDTCIPDIARYFVAFTKEESCGKCAPCRLGTWQMKAILDEVCSGRASLEELELLEELAGAIKVSALCGLGQTAPNPVLTTLRYFRDEYVSHIRWKKCPAAVCEEIVRAPCCHTCPAGVDVPKYVRLVAAGRYDDALAVIRERLPLPSICGHVCFEPCAMKCRRAPLDGRVSVRAIKRFAAASGEARPPERKSATGKKVAVVGSGPAGLTAAHYLALAGHGVTLFEASRELGGMLRDGIPAYRLPRDVLDSEIEFVLRAGVEAKTGTLVRSPPALIRKGLDEEGFDAVFVAPGAGLGAPMGVPGEDLPGVLQAVDFLRDANRGNKVKLGERIAVIGGGNTAMDAARTAVRLGAEEVTVLYRRTREQMPAGPEDIVEAEEEGVGFEFLVAPVEIAPVGIEGAGEGAGRGKNGKLAVHLQRMELGAFDSSGRPRPVPVNRRQEGSEFVLEFDTVIAAIGQQVDLANCEGVETTKRGRLAVVEEETLATSCEGVFVGGDAVTGPASVIEAVAQGRRAAEAIDRFLGGTGDLVRPAGVADAELPPLEEGEIEPVLPPKRPAAERRADFDPIEACYSPDEARRAALRCLRCDLEEAEE